MTGSIITCPRCKGFGWGCPLCFNGDGYLDLPLDARTCLRDLAGRCLLTEFYPANVPDLDEVTERGGEGSHVAA